MAKSGLRTVRAHTCRWRLANPQTDPRLFEENVAGHLRGYSYLSATMGSTRIARRAGR